MPYICHSLLSDSIKSIDVVFLGIAGKYNVNVFVSPAYEKYVFSGEIEIPKTLSLDMSDYKNPQLANARLGICC